MGGDGAFTVVGLEVVCTLRRGWKEVAQAVLPPGQCSPCRAFPHREHSCLLFLLPGLKTGGGSSGGSGNTFHYTFHGDPHATFASFFGGSNPFDIFFASSRSRMFNGFDQEDMDMDDDDDPFSAFGRFGFNGINGVHRRHQESLHTRRKVQDPPVIHELKVSLEEIYHGSTKRMKITRRRLNADGRTMRTEDKILNIVIKRGWKEGTKITFPKEGDATPDNIPADIVFILKDKPHSHFKRDGTNVIYTANISLKEVGTGGKSHGVWGGTGSWPLGPRWQAVLLLLWIGKTR